ncbi:MAG: TetR/AcrR family transcriptional regulator [Limosilactobacillus sp.]
MDRRKKYTQQVIQETLFTLLKKRHLSDITVKEICEQADINRSTFYRNYLDIYDLFEKAEQALSKQAFQNEDLFASRNRLLAIIYDHQDFYREFFHIGLESKQLKQMMGELKEQTAAILKKRGTYHEETFEIEYQYNYYGVLGVIKNWVEHGCQKLPQELGDVLYAIVDRQYQNSTQLK